MHQKVVNYNKLSGEILNVSAFHFFKGSTAGKLHLFLVFFFPQMWLYLIRKDLKELAVDSIHLLLLHVSGLLVNDTQHLLQDFTLPTECKISH